jgi:hypothetical protein
VHGSVIATHFREYVLFGLFFAIVTPLQVLWAGFVLRRPWDVRLLAVGGAASLGIVLVWAMSRTVGLPFGPERLSAEPVGLKDVLASADELLLGAVVAVALVRRHAAAWLPALAWTLASVSLVVALVGGGGH